MKKIMLRKDYQTKVVPVAEAVGHYLVKPAKVVWNETFIDEDTQKPIPIERAEIVARRGCLVTAKVLEELEDKKIKEVEISSIPHRAKELTLFNRIVPIKVTVRNNWGDTAVLIVRSDSLRGAQNLAADYAEGAVNDIFKTEDADAVYVAKSEIIEGIQFIGRTKDDIEQEEAALEKDADAPVKEPFKVKASFIDTEIYEPENTRSKAGVHTKEMFVVWAYDVVTAKNIVFDYIKHYYRTILNERETLRVIGATQFYAHTYVPAEYCNEYIEQKKLKLAVEE